MEMIGHCQLYMFILKVCFSHFCYIDAFGMDPTSVKPRNKTETVVLKTVPCQSSTGAPLRTTAHSEIPTVSLCQSQERYHCGRDQACPPSKQCLTSASALESEISSRVHGHDLAQTLALARLKLNRSMCETTMLQFYNVKIYVIILI